MLCVLRLSGCGRWVFCVQMVELPIHRRIDGSLAVSEYVIGTLSCGRHGCGRLLVLLSVRVDPLESMSI